LSLCEKGITIEISDRKIDVGHSEMAILFHKSDFQTEDGCALMRTVQICNDWNERASCPTILFSSQWKNNVQKIVDGEKLLARKY